MDEGTLYNQLSYVRSVEDIAEVYLGNTIDSDVTFNRILLLLVKDGEIPVDVMVDYLDITQADVWDCLRENM